MKVLIVQDFGISNLLKECLHTCFTNEEFLLTVINLHNIGDILKTNNYYDLVFCDVHLDKIISFEYFSDFISKVPLIFIKGMDVVNIVRFIDSSYFRYIFDCHLRQIIIQALQMKNGLLQIDMLSIYFEIQKENFYTKRMVLHDYDGDIVVPIEQICFFVYENNHVKAYLNETTSYTYTKKSLDALSLHLDPKIFMRVSRKYIVNVNCINHIYNFNNQQKQLSINKFKHLRIIVSKEKVALLYKWIG